MSRPSAAGNSRAWWIQRSTWLGAPFLRCLVALGGFTGAEVAANKRHHGRPGPKQGRRGGTGGTARRRRAAVPPVPVRQGRPVPAGIGQNHPLHPGRLVLGRYRNYLTAPSLQMDGQLVTPLEWLAAGKPPADVIARRAWGRATQDARAFVGVPLTVMLLAAVGKTAAALTR